MTLNVRNISQEQISYSLGEPNDVDTKNTVIGLLKRIHSSSSGNAETIDQLIDDVDDLQETKADKNDTYTKTQVDNALSLKANSNDVYTKTQVYTKSEVNSDLALKADKSDTYTKTQVDNLISEGTISNYVTTDTTQIITGTKTFNELHSGSVYTPNFYMNNKLFNGAFIKENDSSSDNEKICSKSYIEDMILNLIPNLLLGYYPISSNYKGGIATAEAYFRYSNNGTYYTAVKTFPCSYFLDTSVPKRVWINGSLDLVFSNTGSGELLLDRIFVDGPTSGNIYQVLFTAVPWNGTQNYSCGGFIEGEFWHSGLSPNRPLFHVIYLQKTTVNNEDSYMFKYYTLTTPDNIGTIFIRDGRWKIHFKNYLMSHNYS